MSERPASDWRTRVAALWLPLALSTVVAMQVSMLLSMRDVRAGLVHALKHERAMQTLTTTWVGQDGLTHEVTTERNVGESTEEFVARHADLVEVAKKKYPPA